MASLREPRSKESPVRDELQGRAPAQREDEVLYEQEWMVLGGEDRDAFLNALIGSPEPNEKLRAALRRHSEVLGVRLEDPLLEKFLLDLA